jgi:hypothetical protein
MCVCVRVCVNVCVHLKSLALLLRSVLGQP